jgi:hypothetical protein
MLGKALCHKGYFVVVAFVQLQLLRAWRWKLVALQRFFVVCICAFASAAL